MPNHVFPVFIETILGVNGDLPFLNLHLERLIWGCHQVGVHPDGKFKDVFLSKVREALPSSGIYKLRCLTSFKRSVPELTIEISSLTKSNNELLLGIFDKEAKVHGQSWNAKTDERWVYEQAIQYARENGWDDAIVLNARGEVVDTCIYNIFAVIDNVLYTPPLSSYPVKGVMREWIKRNSIFPVVDKIMYPDDLKAADCILATNAVRGIHLALLVES